MVVGTPGVGVFGVDGESVAIDRAGFGATGDVPAFGVAQPAAKATTTIEVGFTRPS